MFYFIVISFLIIFFTLMWFYFFLFWEKLKSIETEIIFLFLSRSSIFPELYEITKDYIIKNDEIYEEVFTLVKQEFFMWEGSQSIEAFFELESKIHHELNFIFQVCNATPKILKEKRFLYMRDIALEKSSRISKKIQYYNQYLKVYNTMITYKNYTLIWFLIPFTFKKILI